MFTFCVIILSSFMTENDANFVAGFMIGSIWICIYVAVFCWKTSRN